MTIDLPVKQARQAHHLELFRWEPLCGDWGSQIGVVELRLVRAPSGLCLRLPVFRSPAGKPVPGMPLIAGEAPASRYSGLYINSDADRARFIEAFDAELETVAPELYGRERRP